MARSSGIDPRLRALYLVAVAVGVFLLPGWELTLAAAASQAALWLALGAGLGALGRQLRKLALFLGVLLVAYALVGTGEGGDSWRRVALGPWELELSVTGALFGLTMVLRVIAVVLASQVARAGDPRALAAGLGRLGVPRAAALSIDATLALLGDEPRRGGGGGGGRGGGGGGRGGGGGGGRGRGGGKSARGFVAGLRRLARGDTTILADRLLAQIDRAEAHIAGADAQPGGRAAARDVAVITGVALTMLGIKALKLLPGLPFAPGHKGVLLIPLYIVAAALTRSRAGATLTGVTMGTAAFVLGDGRWGIFEIAKHIAPGVLVDLLLPLLRGPGRERGALAWSLFGMVVALGRFGTVTAIALTVQAPALVYAVLVPGLALHAVFGAISGIVTARLLRAVETSAARRAKVAPHPPAERGEENAG